MLPCANETERPARLAEAERLLEPALSLLVRAGEGDIYEALD